MRCPLGSYLVLETCVDLPIVQQKTDYKINLMVTFNKNIMLHRILNLKQTFVPTIKKLFGNCMLCENKFYQTDATLSTIVVFSTYITTQGSCGEEFIKDTLRGLEESTFRLNDSRADRTESFTIEVINVDNVGNIVTHIELFHDFDCLRRSLRLDTMTVTSHYFCKSVIVASTLLQNIQTGKVTPVNLGSNFSYVCEEDLIHAYMSGLVSTASAKFVYLKTIIITLIVALNAF